MHPLHQRASEIRDWLVELRRALHREPELSLKEHKTSARCATEMESLGYRVTRNLWGEGFIADLDVEGKDRVAIRADMDALAIQELNDVPYKSCHDGVAHMCGHDTHMTIALGASRILAEHKGDLKHSVRFLFQPSEELPPGGAKGMIENGALDDVTEVFGLHNQPLLPVGSIATCVGPLTAAADIFEIKLVGRGGHAAKPHESLDPIPAACGLVLELQTLVSRETAPDERAVLSVTQFDAGTTHNIIPDSGYLQGTVRTFDDDVRTRIESGMQRMIDAKAQAFGLKAEFKYTRGYDSIVNHAECVDRVARAADGIANVDAIDTAHPAQTWGEDFSYYLQHRPGAFYLLGSGNPDKGIDEPLHSPRFNVDEECLVVGSAIMARLAMGE